MPGPIVTGLWRTARSSVVAGLAGLTVVGSALSVGAIGTGQAGALTPAFPPVSGYSVPAPLPTAAGVNTAVAKGVGFIDTQQNADGSFGISGPGGTIPETSAAIIAYGVLSGGKFTNLPVKFQTDMAKAVTWLLGKQDTTAPSSFGVGGSWNIPSFYYTYSTGLALSALSFSAGVPGKGAAVATAITNGRAFLENNFQGLANETCSTAPTDSSSSYCGGWNYDQGPQRSDTSNTGFALTGLQLTGGVPANIRAVNVGWQNNVQADTTSNAHYSGVRNDGGGSYQPAEVANPGSFTSNANDTGSMLFGYAYDGITSADQRVAAGAQLATDALDTYEKQAHSSAPTPTMVYHTGATQDGSCAPGAPGCDWAAATGEGGFHYSMFTLAKGLGSYIAPNLSDPTNWYTKVADLLIHGQVTTGTAPGSWPADLRDDYSTIFSTGLSVFALGLVAVPPPPVVSVTAAAASATCTQIALSWVNPTTPNYGGVWIQRSTTGYPTSPSVGTRVGDVKAPGTTFTDTGLTQGTTYFYALFAHDPNEEAFAGQGADISAMPVCSAPGHNILGYRLQGQDGGVFDYGKSLFYGSLPALMVSAPIVATANTFDNGGYWLAGSDGSVFAFGNAGFSGSMFGRPLNAPIVGVAGTPDKKGYWLVGADGGVYSFGDAGFYGSMGGSPLNEPIVGMAGSPDGKGYWLVARDGGIFAFGDAAFHGSMGGTHLNKPVVGMWSTNSGQGYWLVASDGGVFALGNAGFYGSAGGIQLAKPVIGMVADPTNGGYWLMASDGGVFTYGNAPFLGAASQSPPSPLFKPITSAST